jgi:hypothetical protein
MSISPLKPADWLDLLISKAPALRAAGVLEVSLEGVSVKLSEFIPEQPESKDAIADATGDPMNDRILYGGALPGFPKLHEIRVAQYEDDDL